MIIPASRGAGVGAFRDREEPMVASENVSSTTAVDASGRSGSRSFVRAKLLVGSLIVLANGNVHGAGIRNRNYFDGNP